jgi:L-iditol 2-dehydrogenase
MQVAVYYNNEDVRIEEREMPRISEGEILLATKACGICGTDVAEWYRAKQAPLVLGHEAVGVITEIGSKVSRYEVGDKVFVSHHIPCNNCIYCLKGEHTTCDMLHTTNYYPGGFSQFIRVPETHLSYGIYPLFDLSFEEGTLIEPLGCVLRTQRRLNIGLSDTVLIMGAGVSGMLHAICAKERGARVVLTDTVDHKLKRAEELVADFTIPADEDIPRVLKERFKRLADVVIIATGAVSACQKSFECVDKGGTICFFAVSDPRERLFFPSAELWKKSIKIVTSYGAAPRDLSEAIGLIRRLNLHRLITHRLPFEKISEGFKMVAEAKDCLKVVILF